MLPVAWVLLAPLLAGCVTRTLRIESEPPGAEVHLDGKAVGTTPYTETFLSYGVRRVDLRLPGHEWMVTEIDVERPWWQVLPISIVSELLVPFPIEDHHDFRFTLVPQPVLTPQEAEHQAFAVYERLKAHKRRTAATWPELAGPPPGSDAP